MKRISKKALIEKLRRGPLSSASRAAFFIEGVGRVDRQIVEALEKEGVVQRISCGIWEGEDCQTYRFNESALCT